MSYETTMRRLYELISAGEIDAFAEHLADGFDVAVIDIMRFGGDDSVHEHWGLFDSLGMMQQLGAIPAPAAA